MQARLLPIPLTVDSGLVRHFCYTDLNAVYKSAHSTGAPWNLIRQRHRPRPG